MNHTALPTTIAATVAATNDDLARIAPEAKGKSVIALHEPDDGAAELLIYGPIGDYFWDGISAREVVAQIGAVTASEIVVRINSDGGVVSDGLAIYNALKRHASKVTVTIDGIAASIASLIAMVGDTVAMHANTLLMIHAPIGACWGNAVAMRQQAEVLDTFAKAMQASYTAKAAKPADIEQMLTDGIDHYFTAEEALAFGLVDEVVSADADAPADASAAAAALLSYVTAIANAQGPVHAALRRCIQSATTPAAFASLREGHQRAVLAHIEDPTMKQQCHLILAQAGGAAPAAAATPSPAPTAAASPSPAASAAGESRETLLAALGQRNEAIRGVFAQFRDIAGVRDLEAECLANPAMTIEQAQARLLARVGGGAGPLSDPATAGRGVEVVVDEADKRTARIVQGILARAGVLHGTEADEARQGNTAARQSLIALAEDSLIRAGINTRNMSRDQIAASVLAVQTTSDFPVLLESTLHKMLLTAYRLQPFTWTRFCATGSLSDYRPHNRYHLGSFTDLKPVNEAGEYETGVMSDGAKETIQGRRKGRILQITPEVLVNDDLGAFTRPTQVLGQAAGRTIENDVYALFALNAGAGPTLSDGNPLFHASHGNIAATGGAPSVALLDAIRQQMGSQKDPGGNDYLDIVPQIFLGPLSLGGVAREINAMEFNDEAQKNQRRPNIVRGLFRDVIDTPRLSGAAWYVLADPGIEPVFEVAFLDGVQTPTLEQEKNFRTDGLAWKVVHRYGVAAVGAKGIVKNAGA